MNSPARRVGLPYLAAAVAMLGAGDCLADQAEIKWRANPFLILNRSSTNCGANFREDVDLEFDGKVLKSSGSSGGLYELHLVDPLRADGSGTVNAIGVPSNRSMIIKFDPGQGPRVVHVWGRYSTRCVWKLIPLPA